MGEIRFNYGDKFTQTTDTNTGIGSTIPTAKLDIAGGTSAGSLRVSGIASLSSYQKFVNTKLSTTEDLIVEAGNSGSVSGEVVVSTGQTISVSTGATTGQGGIQSLKVMKHSCHLLEGLLIDQLMSNPEWFTIIKISRQLSSGMEISGSKSIIQQGEVVSLDLVDISVIRVIATTNIGGY